MARAGCNVSFNFFGRDLIKAVSCFCGGAASVLCLPPCVNTFNRNKSACIGNPDVRGHKIRVLLACQGDLPSKFGCDVAKGVTAFGGGVARLPSGIEDMCNKGNVLSSVVKHPHGSVCKCITSKVFGARRRISGSPRRTKGNLKHVHCGSLSKSKHVARSCSHA